MRLEVEGVVFKGLVVNLEHSGNGARPAGRR
jgi:hypothetical protein